MRSVLSTAFVRCVLALHGPRLAMMDELAKAAGREVSVPGWVAF